MKVAGRQYRSLWWSAEEGALQIIDQRWLPHDLRIDTVRTMDAFCVGEPKSHLLCI